MTKKPRTLGDLKASGYRSRGVKDELRENLRRALSRGEKPFVGIHGYDRTVLPSLHNAILSRHDFLLLGLRGQAKTRLLRMLVQPPRSRDSGDRGQRAQRGSARADHQVRAAHRRREGRRRADRLASARGALPREARDAGRHDRGPHRRHRSRSRRRRERRSYSDEEVIHFGIVPRTNRGIFAINELPGPAAAHPGRPPEHPRGARPPDPRLPRPHPARHPARLLGQPRGLHEPRQHHHAAEGPDLVADLHALPGRREDRGAASRRRRPGSSATAARRSRSRSSSASSIEEIAFAARASEFVDQSSGVSARMPISALEILASNLERRGLVQRRVARLAAAVRPAGDAAGDHRQGRDGVRGRAAGRGGRRQEAHRHAPSRSSSTRSSPRRTPAARPSAAARSSEEDDEPTGGPVRRARAATPPPEKHPPALRADRRVVLGGERDHDLGRHAVRRASRVAAVGARPRRRRSRSTSRRRRKRSSRSAWSSCSRA